MLALLVVALLGLGLGLLSGRLARRKRRKSKILEAAAHALEEQERYKRLAFHIHVYPEEGESDEEFVARFKARFLHTNEEMP